MSSNNHTPRVATILPPIHPMTTLLHDGTPNSESVTPRHIQEMTHACQERKNSLYCVSNRLDELERFINQKLMERQATMKHNLPK
jgi:hypothetical protein